MDLTHHFLLSMPTLANSWFDKSITYIYEHSDTGAIGFVINRHTQMASGDIYDQLKIDCEDKTRRSVPVFQGGPVDEERGFILCASNTIPEQSLSASTEETNKTTDSEKSRGDIEQATANRYHSNDHGIAISSSIELLSELGQGQGPTSHLLLLGYAGWAAGQLESEIASNSWLTCAATTDIIFHQDCDKKFTLAAQSIGVDFSLMSGDAGHA